MGIQSLYSLTLFQYKRAYTRGQGREPGIIGITYKAATQSDWRSRFVLVTSRCSSFNNYTRGLCTFMHLQGRLGHAQTSFYSHDDPVTVPSKRSNTDSTPLLAICKKITPPCKLNPLLFNGHLQTFWTTVKNYDIPIYYK